MMFKHRLDQELDTSVVLHWFLLSFNAGCINAGGFLATGRFVSHVTGFATLFGVELVNHQHESAWGILSVPLFFLVGSFLAGWLVDRPIYRHQKPHFDYVMGLSALCLFLAAYWGEVAQFGSFGGVFNLKEAYILLALLCLACGLQNAAVTSSSRGSVRTTHLTGLTTDLGLGIAKELTLPKGKIEFHQEKQANRLRLGSIIAFVLGSAVGSWFFMSQGYRGFFLSGLIATYAAWHGRKTKQ